MRTEKYFSADPGKLSLNIDESKYLTIEEWNKFERINTFVTFYQSLQKVCKVENDLVSVSEFRSQTILIKGQNFFDILDDLKQFKESSSQ